MRLFGAGNQPCGKNSKWIGQYNTVDLMTTDLVKDILMESTSDQGYKAAISLLIPHDTPRVDWEYRMALSYFEDETLKYYPKYKDPSAPRPIAIRVMDDCPIAPFELLGHWVRMALLGYAVSQYTGVVECFITLQQTSFQFCDDVIAQAGTKLAIGVSAFLLKNSNSNFHPTNFSTASGHILKVIRDEKTYPYLKSLGKDIRFSVEALNTVLGSLWYLKLNNAMPRIQKQQKLESLKQAANAIDKATNNDFNLEFWIGELPPSLFNL